MQDLALPWSEFASAPPQPAPAPQPEALPEPRAPELPAGLASEASVPQPASLEQPAALPAHMGEHALHSFVLTLPADDPSLTATEATVLDAATSPGGLAHSRATQPGDAGSQEEGAPEAVAGGETAQTRPAPEPPAAAASGRLGIDWDSMDFSFAEDAEAAGTAPDEAQADLAPASSDADAGRCAHDADAEQSPVAEQSESAAPGDSFAQDAAPQPGPHGMEDLPEAGAGEAAAASAGDEDWEFGDFAAAGNEPGREWQSAADTTSVVQVPEDVGSWDAAEQEPGSAAAWVPGWEPGEASTAPVAAALPQEPGQATSAEASLPEWPVEAADWRLDGGWPTSQATAPVPTADVGLASGQAMSMGQSLPEWLGAASAPQQEEHGADWGFQDSWTTPGAAAPPEEPRQAKDGVLLLPEWARHQ